MTDDTSQPDELAQDVVRLAVRVGRDRGKDFPLPARGEMVLGRGDDCDIVLRDGEVSRRHCSIHIADGHVQIKDLDSINGMFVDGRKVAEAELDSGAEVRVGQTVLSLILPQEARAAAALAPVPEQADAPVAVAEEPAGIEAPPRLATQPPRPRRRRRLVCVAAILALAVGLAFAYPTVSRYVGPGARSISVQSSPAKAEVFLDNRFAGITPVSVEMAGGQPHVVRLVKRGYITRRVRIGDETPGALEIALESEPLATLIVSASRPDTEVHLDGRLVGKTGGRQPLRIPEVKLGPHDLRFQLPNYIPYHKRIDVRRSGNMSIHAPLQSRQATSILNLIAKQPNSALLYTELGHAHMVNRQLDKGMGAYKKAFELVYSGKDSSGYHRRLKAEVTKILQGQQGVFHYGNDEERRVACQKLEDVFIELARTYPTAQVRLSSLARYYTSRNQADDAIRLYRKMIGIQPDSLDLYYKVASLCANKNDHEAAILLLKQAEQKFPKTWGIHYRLGVAYSQRAATDLSENDRQQAIRHLGTALALCASSTQKRNIQHYLDKARALKFE
jgi:tetratricopeptide (TPR) repeat protein